MALFMDSNRTCISRTTLWRRLKEAGYQFGKDKFTNVSDKELGEEIKSIKENFPMASTW